MCYYHNGLIIDFQHVQRYFACATYIYFVHMANACHNWLRLPSAHPQSCGLYTTCQPALECSQIEFRYRLSTINECIACAAD